ncbi:hypothetical protein BWI93_13070, partial [Siphonobacter sp. BAB-5385]|uniref:hypothetical protein n=1 Tax=Siphonobacter sp. BAB-5385 TaxID=1864822 RepID=UPI000BC8792C
LVGEKDAFQLEAGTSATPYVAYSVSETLTGIKIDSSALAPSSVTNATLANRSVSAAKVDFITTQAGKNLFNKKTKKVGYFVNENGVEQANATYTLSDFIPVISAQTYFGRGNATTGMRFVGFYTDKTDASFVKGAGPTTATTTFTTPASGIAYVRLSILTADTASFQLELGTSRTAYEEYKESFVLKNIASDGISQTAREQIVADVKTSLATEKPLTSDFALAAKIYWPVGRQLEIYPENCLKLYEKWKGYLDLTSTITSSKQTGRALKATPAATGTYTVTTTAYDSNYETAYTLTTQVQAVPLTSQ